MLSLISLATSKHVTERESESPPKHPYFSEPASQDEKTSSQVIAEAMCESSKQFASAIKESMLEYGKWSKLESYVASGLITREEARDIIFGEKNK